MTRFFVEGIVRVGEPCEIVGEDARKLKLVMRARVGDELEILDSAGARYRCTIERLDRDALVIPRERLLEPPPARTLRFTLAQGIPKGSKMEYVVEKASELGVARLVPLVTERCIARDCSPGKYERWRRLARSAALQCGRSEPMEIAAPLTLEALLLEAGTYGAILMPWELAPLHSPLPLVRDALAGVESALGLVGPEGGFSAGEAERAAAAGARMLRFGARILRTETAGVVLSAAVLLTVL
ncbi:MAG: 16S rRNA (uracil(1498)-N(3))-methyltransferase [Candidatus Eremiobacteraeota bacterium]|nr:RsmE family RNA methyltransferase [Candidatus Eremiobacteraeota bacterium]NNM93157.1 16S rRNA (uracil(1498)-N(3))-methyltransferase [Candidatus Eremiobacteraeota bacterium]